MASARFLLRPLWLLSHVLVLAAVVVMVNLGFWQLDRLDQRRERNDVIEARSSLPAVPVEQLVDPDAPRRAVDGARFRTVTVTGAYDADDTVVVRNRSQDGAAGAWLVTPVDLAGGERVGVIRGFVTFGADGAIEQPAPPPGEVTVRGMVIDPDKLDGTAPGDLAALQDDPAMLPVVVRADRSDPPEPSAPDPSGTTAGTIRPVPPADLDEGPHLGYAVQWFIFATIGAVGYPLVLRSVVRRRPVDRPASGDDDHERGTLLRQSG